MSTVRRRGQSKLPKTIEDWKRLLQALILSGLILQFVLNIDIQFPVHQVIHEVKNLIACILYRQCGDAKPVNAASPATPTMEPTSSVPTWTPRPTSTSQSSAPTHGAAPSATPAQPTATTQPTVAGQVGCANVGQNTGSIIYTGPITCELGRPGLPGPQGPQGVQGPQGPQGPAGEMVILTVPVTSVVILPSQPPTQEIIAPPTSIPATATPTLAPTAVPTAIPTTVPTAVPTVAPTAVPTAVPTVEPTVAPTAVPTAVPTTVPTAVPTAEPTTIPTVTPIITPTCELVAQPLDIMLAIDQSSSMEGGELEDAQQAAISFVDQIDITIDQIGLVAFSNDANTGATLGRDRVVVDEAIRKLKPKNGTNIAAGLLAAQAELTSSHRNPAAKPVVILLSDGKPNKGDTPSAVASLKAQGIEIITIGLGKHIDEALLREMASSEADYHYAPSSADLKEVYREIVRNIHSCQ